MSEQAFDFFENMDLDSICDVGNQSQPMWFDDFPRHEEIEMTNLAGSLDERESLAPTYVELYDDPPHRSDQPLTQEELDAMVEWCRSIGMPHTANWIHTHWTEEGLQ